MTAHERTRLRWPNGQRISGERRAEGDERVRCMRVLGGALLDRSAWRTLRIASAEPTRPESGGALPDAEILSSVPREQHPGCHQDAQAEHDQHPVAVICPLKPPNGQRISGERRAEGDERVRCMRVLGSGPRSAPTKSATMPYGLEAETTQYLPVI